jgi:hypothetical protein
MRPKPIISFFSFLSLCLALSLIIVLLQSARALEEFPVDVPPPWLKVGTYVEYKVWVTSFPTGTEATLRWECISLDGTVATLNVSHTAASKMPGYSHISPGSATLQVLTDTREALYPNGTVIGKTFLWVPPFLSKDQKVVLEGKPPDEKIGIVYWDGGSCTWTSGGYQETNWIRPYNGTWFSAHFDVNTGILIASSPFPSAVIEALGVKGLIGGAPTIVATNVDLGPQFLRTLILHTIWNNLPIVIPIIFLITAFLLIRRKRKRQKARYRLDKT